MRMLVALLLLLQLSNAAKIIGDELSGQCNSKPILDPRPHSDPSHWELVNPLPSYGRGVEVPGKRYRSLINGYNLHDVVITGDDGVIDGQGLVWWDWFTSHSLNYSRPHLVEFEDSEYVVVSNLSFLNTPAYNIHPVYCSNVYVFNISVSAPSESPYTVGIVPDVSGYSESVIPAPCSDLDTRYSISSLAANSAGKAAVL
ncbi:putative polygalacturonase, partial [Cucurbita argyrosperma subsp. sororia]